MKRFFFSLLIYIFIVGQPAYGQEPNYNVVLSDDIGAVTFHLKNFVLAEPIIYLNSYNQLELRFDDLTAGDNDYIYVIEHCDADWTPSRLDELDYIQGFNSEPLTDFKSSFTTNVQYRQFYLTLPNDNIRFKVSGNYLLKIYEDTNERKLALVRRFMVTESAMTITPRFRARPTNGQWRSDQEFEFEVGHKGIKVINPITDIKATVLQNSRWDNALIAVSPHMIRSESVLFNKQGMFIFSGGKEFRRLDMRSLQYGSGKIGEIIELNDGYEVYLKPEKKRAYGSYFTRQDINGKYIIENLDNRAGGGVIAFDLGGQQEYTPDGKAYVDLSNSLPRDLAFARITDTSNSFNPYQSRDRYDDNRIQENNQLRGDYADVYFFLKSPTEFEDQDIYLFGGFSDWLLLDGYKMSYIEKYKAYEGRAFLKQGYYEYYYATVPKGSKKVSIDDTEGSHYETENEYSVL